MGDPRKEKAGRSGMDALHRVGRAFPPSSASLRKENEEKIIQADRQSAASGWVGGEVGGAPSVAAERVRERKFEGCGAFDSGRCVSRLVSSRPLLPPSSV